MQAEKVAEITAQIVSSALMSGSLPASNTKTVCDFYAAIHAQILACKEQADNHAQASFAGKVIEPA